MIQEIAEIEVIPGQEEAFEQAVAKAAPHFKAAAGCRGLRLLRSIEHRSRYRLVVDWETLEDHTVGFRQSEGFSAWRALAAPFFAAPPSIEHVEAVLSPF